MSKNNIIKLVTLVVGLVLVGFYVWTSNVQQISDVVNSPEPSVTEIPSVSLIPTKTPNITKVPVPLPSGDGRTTFIDETVPWSLLLADASCELKGEIKFINSNTYDNQNALLIYKGIDDPSRNIFWTVTPQDNISVGPNIFSKIPIPNGESLLGGILPTNPKYKKYELTARIRYGRLVDANGNFVTENGYVKVMDKQCVG